MRGTLPSLHFPTAPGAQLPRFATAFWNCRLSELEKWVLPICITITMLLQVKAVLYSALALPLIVVMAALCWLSPITGFFYIACAQFLPFPEGMRLNPAQIGVATWLLVTFIRYRKMDLSGLGQLWPVLPWLLWFWLITGEAIYQPNSEYFKAITYSIIACQQVNVAKGHHLKCLLGMCLGTLMATTAFWAYQLGFGVDLSTWGGERSGFARLGGVRADAVMIWPPLLMGCFGTLGLTLSAMVSGRFPDQIKRLKTLSVAAFFISIPPLVATDDARRLRRLRPDGRGDFDDLHQPETAAHHQARHRAGGADCHQHGGGDHPDVCAESFPDAESH
jgi:hypothetical protein